ARARVPAGPDGLHAAAARVFTGKRARGYSPLVRSAALALVCALAGAGAALGIALAAGLLDRSTTRTVVVREPGLPRNVPAAVRSVAPVAQAGFSPARIYARRSP